MACLRPLKAIYEKPYTDDNTGEYRKGKLIFDGDIVAEYPDVYEDKFVKVIFVPCGNCSGCAIDYANYWSNRVLMESFCHKDCYFITLTYSDNCCPKSVSKSDAQKFMKRLRYELSKSNIKCRYFLGSEYGGTTLRPHYHLILFGVDLMNYGHHRIKPGLFYSDLIGKCWKWGFNSCAVGNIKTIKYVCKYSIKRTMRPKYEREALKAKGFEPEFSLKSTHPALGTELYAELVANNSLLENGGTFYLSGQKVFLPKLFLHKLKDALGDEKLFQDTIDGFILSRDIDARNILDSHKLSDVGSVFAQRAADRIANQRKKI